MEPKVAEPAQVRVRRDVLRALAGLDLRLLAVTNQSVIGRGWATAEMFAINWGASMFNEYVRDANFNQISPRSFGKLVSVRLPRNAL